ncbi:MAG TPA: glycosyltransferase, partial [Vicinamibacterales bacterium]|nr:glycosyltransferase [Vicinamibacterales bacterium]
GRIRRYYNRGSVVVYPPVDTDFYRPADDRRAPDPCFLAVSALVPYKRLDVAIEACRRVGAPLKIVGSGPELARLARRAGPEVEFLGWRADEEVRALYRSATAVVLPGVEDFGMVPVEAQACGCPVVALAEGGSLETVRDGETGVLVPEGSPEALADGLARARTLGFDRTAIRAHALQFSRDRFLAGFKAAVDDAVKATAKLPSAPRNVPPSPQQADREDAEAAASGRTAKLPSAPRNVPPSSQQADREDEQ